MPLMLYFSVAQTHFSMVLDCLVKVLKNKIITSENDMFGVMFVGTVRG